jgi:hypothetical protein
LVLVCLRWHLRHQLGIQQRELTQSHWMVEMGAVGLEKEVVELELELD